jgi:hypothetical protein
MNQKVVSVIKYLVNDYNKWSIKEYDEDPCTFSIAMALNVIAKGFRQIESETYYQAVSKVFYDETEECPACPFDDSVVA